MPVDERLSCVRDDPPSVAEQREQRAFQRARLESWFLAHPGVECEAEELEHLAGPNYRSRFHEMAIRVKNVPRWTLLADGRKRKDRGAYVYRPEQVGRSASEYRIQPSLI